MLNLKGDENFTRGLPKMLEDFANTFKVEHNSSSLEPSFSFHSLVNLVDKENITLEKFKTQELSLESLTLYGNFNQNATLTNYS